jgi:hypothetical protein
MIDALKLVLRDKHKDLEDIRTEKRFWQNKLDVLHDEEQTVLRDIADLEKHIAETEGDVN